MPGHNPRLPECVQRYQPGKQIDAGSPAEHINALGMVCSLLGLLMRVSWFVRVTLRACNQKEPEELYFSPLYRAEMGGMELVYLANSRTADDNLRNRCSASSCKNS